MKQRDGYTLVELMVVVAIILITAGIAGPAFMRSLALTRASYGAQDLLRLSRHARSVSLANGRATLLLFGQVAGSSRVELWARDYDDANRHRCPSPAPALGAAGVAAGWTQVDFVDAANYQIGNSTVQFELHGFSGGSDAICFRPNGDMMVEVGGTFSVPPNLQVVRIRNLVGGSETLPAREVVYPFLAAPRMRLDANGAI